MRQRGRMARGIMNSKYTEGLSNIEAIGVGKGAGLHDQKAEEYD